MQSIITDDRVRSVSEQIDDINVALAERIGKQKFRIWFENSTNLSLANGYLKVDVPNSFIANWIENHFSNEICEAVHSVTGSEVKVTFTIDPQLTGHQRRSQFDSNLSVSKSDGKGRFRAGLEKSEGIGAFASQKNQRKKLKSPSNEWLGRWDARCLPI